jgi:hypothetical protein
MYTIVCIIYVSFIFQVTGEESLTQVLACLSHYRNRPLYLTKAFKELYNLSCTDNLKDDVELRKRIIEVHTFYFTAFILTPNCCLRRLSRLYLTQLSGSY